MAASPREPPSPDSISKRDDSRLSTLADFEDDELATAKDVHFDSLIRYMSVLPQNAIATSRLPSSTRQASNNLTVPLPKKAAAGDSEPKMRRPGSFFRPAIDESDDVIITEETTLQSGSPNFKRQVAIRFDDKEFVARMQATAKSVENEESDMRVWSLSEMCKSSKRNKQALTDVFRDKYGAMVEEDATALEPENLEQFYELAVRAIMLYPHLDEEKKAKEKDPASKEDDQKSREKLLHHIADALRVEESTFLDVQKKFADRAQRRQALKHELETHLQNVRNHPYYKRSAFASDDEFNAWVETEKKKLAGYLAGVSRAIKSEKSAASRILSSGGDSSVNITGTKKKKKGFFACFCGGDVEEVVEPASKPVKAVPTRDEDEDEDSLAEEPQVVNGILNTAIDYGPPFQLLLWILVQHDAKMRADNHRRQLSRNTSGVSLDVDEHDGVNQITLLTKKGIQSAQLGGLSENSEAIIKRYGEVYRLGEVNRQLQHLELLSWNLQNNARFFELCGALIDDLEEMRRNGRVPWLKAELKRYTDLVQELFSWCERCLSRYQSVFLDNIAALGKCVELINILWDPLVEVCGRPDDDAALRNAVEKKIKEAVTVSYNDLIMLSKMHIPVEHLGEGGGAGSMEQELNINNSVSVDLFREERDREINVLGNINDLHQLFQVISSIEEEIKIAKDMQQCFDSLPDFSFPGIVAETFLPLLWSDAQMFLRMLANRLASEQEQEQEELKSPRSPRLFSSPTPSHSGPSHKVSPSPSRLAVSPSNARAKSPRPFKDIPEYPVTRQIDKIFRLYDLMKKFYVTVGRIVDLPKSQLAPWFEPFVTAWIQQRAAKFSFDYIDGLIQNDDFSPIDAKAGIFYSHSVTELFTLLYPINTRFQTLPCSPEQVKLFAEFLGSVVQAYVEKVVAKVAAIIQREEKEHPKTFGFTAREDGYANCLPPSLIVMLNSIRICKKQLFDTLKDIKLDVAYEKAQKPDLRSTATFLSTSVPSLPAHVDDEDDEDENDNALLISDIFRFLSEKFDELAHHLAVALARFPIAVIDVFIASKPIEQIFDPENPDDYDAVVEKLRPVWNYLICMFDFLAGKAGGAALVDDSIFILSSQVITRIAEHLEVQLLYPLQSSLTKKLHLMRSQVIRVHMAATMIPSFFEDEYELPAVFIGMLRKDKAILHRVGYLTDLLFETYDKSTPELAKLYDKNEPEENKRSKEFHDVKEAKETFRREHLPFMLCDQIMSIMKHRKEEERDQLAADFVKKHKKGFFGKLFS